MDFLKKLLELKQIICTNPCFIALQRNRILSTNLKFSNLHKLLKPQLSDLSEFKITNIRLQRHKCSKLKFEARVQFLYFDCWTLDEKIKLCEVLIGEIRKFSFQKTIGMYKTTFSRNPKSYFIFKEIMFSPQAAQILEPL